jgi:hypothetical protein
VVVVWWWCGGGVVVVWWWCGGGVVWCGVVWCGVVWCGVVWQVVVVKIIRNLLINRLPTTCFMRGVVRVECGVRCARYTLFPVAGTGQHHTKHHPQPSNPTPLLLSLSFPFPPTPFYTIHSTLQIITPAHHTNPHPISLPFTSYYSPLFTHQYPLIHKM